MQRMHWLTAVLLASAIADTRSWPHSKPAARRALQDGAGSTYFGLRNVDGSWDERLRVLPPSQVCACSWGQLQGSLTVAIPANACVMNTSANYKGAFVLVERGGCHFATKAKHMQRAGATGMVVCDNGTGGGDPVNIGLGSAASELTLGIVAVNAETSVLLHSYVARPQRGETYQLYTEGCPYNMDQFTSQVLVWSIGVVSCIVAAYMSAAHERRIASGATLPYDFQAMETRGRDDPDDDDGDLTIMQAVAFTVLASAVLVVLYFFIADLIIVVIVFYCVGATGALHHLLCIVGATLFPSLHRQVYNLPYFGNATMLMILCFLPAVCTSSAWFYFRHKPWAWALQNILSFSLCIQILSLIRVSSVRITACLLSMMFFYDIFWVFVSKWIFGGQGVMVAVATGGGGESLPMLFMMPHDCGYSLLGLGDVVIPGVLLSLNIRLDYLKNVPPFSTDSYFVYSCIAYAVGLAAADAAVTILQEGQPALLYLVPCTLGTTIGLATSRGEFGWVWEKPFETNESYVYTGGSSINRDRTRALSQEARTRLL